jgi:hypothetical protein
MAPQATLPRGDVNVPSDYFSLAGFEVIMHGRFWVLTEELLGHSDVRVTMRYVRAVEDTKRVAVEAIKLSARKNVQVLASWPKQPPMPAAVNH